MSGEQAAAPAALPNPLMQPANAGRALLHPRPALPAATMDRRLSHVRLQLIRPSFGSPKHC